MPPSPDVWTDGSLVRDEVSGSAFAGAACMPITGGTGDGGILMILVLSVFFPCWFLFFAWSFADCSEG